MIQPALSASEFAEVLQSSRHGIKVTPHMTNGEAMFIISTMPDHVVESLKSLPRFRINGESPEAYLIRARLQRAMKIDATFAKK